MSQPTDYENLINDILTKQILILGPDIVLMKARNVLGLKLNDAGKVSSISGDPQQVLQNLKERNYMQLSGQIVKNILKSGVCEAHPHIKVPIN